MGVSPDRLSPRAKEAILSENNHRLVSHATLWELAIKISIGKLVLHQDSFEAFLRDGLSAAHAELLPVDIKHIQGIVSLPMHHRDPFDRMIIEQALAEGIPVVSSDEVFDAYGGVQRIW